MCILAKKRNENHLSEDVLDWKIIKNVIDEICSFLFKPIIHFSGGEPLIHNDFLKICSYCGQKKLNWTITTNGFYLSDYAKEIVKYGCRCVNVSIDGTEEIHNLIRGSGNSYQKAIDGIIKIAELKKNNKRKAPLILATCTINDKNHAHLKEIADMFDSLPLDSFSFQHLSFGKDFIFGEDFNYEAVQDMDIENLKNNINGILNKNYYKPVFFVPYLRVKDIGAYYRDLNYDFGSSCINPWVMAEIKPNGKVIICHREIGDININSLKEIWNSPEGRRVRHFINKGVLSNRCLRCCHRRYK